MNKKHQDDEDDELSSEEEILQEIYTQKMPTAIHIHVTSSSFTKEFGIAHKIRTNQYRVYPIQSIIQ